MSAVQWTDDFLEPKRALGDPTADAVIQAVLDESGEEGLQKVLTSLVTHLEIVPAELPPVVQNYFAQTDDVPAWVDSAQVAKAEDIFMQYGLEICAILLCASLPECYACAKGVHVLFISNQLTQFVERRIVETSQFVLDVMAPGGLRPGGDGITAAQKIRLLHATMRQVMLRHNKWDMAWGFPLNQEDMAITLMTFSPVVIDSLRKMNLALTPEEEAAYYHAWRFVGHLIGVPEDLNPSTLEEGRALFEAICRRQHKASPEGQAVTKALIDFADHIIPGTVFDGYVNAKIRHLIGDPLADDLAVPQPDWTALLIKPAKFFLGLTQEMSQDTLISRLVNIFSREILLGFQRVDRGGNRPMFHVPEALQQQWKLPPTPQPIGSP